MKLTFFFFVPYLGLATSLIEIQLDIFILDKYQFNLTLLKNIKRLSNALGLFFLSTLLIHLIANVNDHTILIVFVGTFMIIGLTGLLLRRNEVYENYNVRKYPTFE